MVSDLRRAVTEHVPGVGSFAFRAGGFFQNNSAILPAFVEHVVDAAVGAGAGGEPLPLLLDVYCGVGLFAIAASGHFRRVFGVELDGDAVRMARRNAQAAGRRNVTFLAGDAAEGLAQAAAVEGTAVAEAVVVVDPPRQGRAQKSIGTRADPWDERRPPRSLTPLS